MQSSEPKQSLPSNDGKQNSIKIARRNAIIIASALVVLFVVMVVALVVTTLNTKKPAQRYTPGDYSPGYREDAKIINEQDQPAADAHNAIGALVSKLPYKGKNFSLDFDFHFARYKAVISQKNKAAGDQEFDEFLKSNGINSRGYFTNLNVEYK